MPTHYVRSIAFIVAMLEWVQSSIFACSASTEVRHGAEIALKPINTCGSKAGKLERCYASTKCCSTVGEGTTIYGHALQLARVSWNELMLDVAVRLRKVLCRWYPYKIVNGLHVAAAYKPCKYARLW